VDNDSRSGRDDQDNMSSDRNCKCYANRPVSSKVRVGNPRTKKRHDVDPELIESSNTSRSSLSEAKGARLAIVTSSSFRASWKRLLNEVGNLDLLIHNPVKANRFHLQTTVVP
jgi:hypothetical protein